MALMRRGGDPGDDATDIRQEDGPGLATQDLPFYRGKSPVLGAPVELRQSGTLPGEFPAAGGGGRPPIGPGDLAPGSPPNPGDFTFEWSGGEFPAPPNRPTIPPFDIMGPGGGRPAWWQSAMGAAESVGSARDSLAKLDRLGAMGSGNGSPLDVARFNLGGQGIGEWWGGAGEPNFSLFGPEGGDVLDPSQFSLGMDASKLDVGGLVGGGLQAAGGLYGAATGTPGSPGHIASSANAIGGLSALGASAGILPGAMSALGPAAALVSLPLILGPQIAGMLQGDKARWPEGYQFIPGSSKSGGAGAMAVDPSTGAVLVYKGDGRYEFHEATRGGQLPSPDDFRGWEIAPSGALAGREGYGGLAKEFRDRRLSPERAGLAGGSGGATQVDVRSAQQDARAPAINALRARFPGLTEAQYWHLYTLSPEYQAEQARMWQMQYATPINDR